MAKYADRDRRRRDKHNPARRSKFADSDVPPPDITVDPDPAYAWALDHFMTTAKTSKHRVRRLDGEMTKYGKEWSLS